MNDQELRQMVRESIARLAAGASAAPSAPAVLLQYASFLRLPVVSGGDDDGACLIEPTVRCNHCGYCQSYGH